MFSADHLVQQPMFHVTDRISLPVGQTIRPYGLAVAMAEELDLVRGAIAGADAARSTFLTSDGHLGHHLPRGQRLDL
jgi:hypothetical protein